MFLSDFFEMKNGMAESTCEQFHKWRTHGCKVTILRMDNAGENVLLKQRCKSEDWKFGVDFKFTARDALQQSSLAEVGFTVCANRGRALVARANASNDTRHEVWTAAFKTATLLDGLMPVEIGGATKTRHEHWCVARTQDLRGT